MADLLLPPNDFPWFEADGQERRDFPAFFADRVLPWLYKRTILRYATTAARNADLAGLGSTDMAFAYVDALKCMTKWTGTVWTGDWVTMAINTGSGWAAQAGQIPRARILLDDNLQLSGAVTYATGITRDDPFALPPGMRPTGTRYLPGHTTSSVSLGTSFQAYVESSGALFIDATYAGGVRPSGVAYPISGIIPLT